MTSGPGGGVGCARGRRGARHSGGDGGVALGPWGGGDRFGLPRAPPGEPPACPRPQAAVRLGGGRRSLRRRRSGLRLARRPPLPPRSPAAMATYKPVVVQTFPKLGERITQDTVYWRGYKVGGRPRRRGGPWGSGAARPMWVGGWRGVCALPRARPASSCRFGLEGGLWYRPEAY